jgi:hypothetical protein
MNDLKKLEEVFGPPVRMIGPAGEEIPVFRPNWRKDEPIEEETKKESPDPDPEK